MMHSNDDFLDPITSFVETKSMDAISDQLVVGVLGTTSMEICTTQDGAVVAKAILVQEAPDRTS